MNNQRKKDRLSVMQHPFRSKNKILGEESSAVVLLERVLYRTAGVEEEEEQKEKMKQGKQD